MQSPKRPLGSFIFLGPTGVGKQSCAALGEAMFGDEDANTPDMMNTWKSIQYRMVGSPPGYVGYDEGDSQKQCAESRIRLLLDEVEKAHPDVFNMLLQI